MRPIGENKRGLSQVVTTLLLILLIIGAVAGIWVVIRSFVTNSSGQISSSKYSINLQLQSATVNYSTGVADVSVFRNSGPGDLVGIKFIFGDGQNSDVFVRSFSSFPELATRTYSIDLSKSSVLNLPKVNTVSIAPVIQVGTRNLTGSIAGTVGNLDINANVSNAGTAYTYLPVGASCNTTIQCGKDQLIPNSQICNSANTGVLQYKTVFSCTLGFCLNSTQQVLVESCANGSTCYNGACVQKQVPCTNATISQVCGNNSWVGNIGCSNVTNATTQFYQTFSCVSGYCQSNTQLMLKANCSAGEICHNGQCFVPQQCTQNSDCPFGQVCKQGNCTKETAMFNGTVQSVWPPGYGEYFDSPDLPLDQYAINNLNYVIFPNSSQTSCLKVKSFVAPQGSNVNISYIRLNQSKTNVAAGDKYQIWQTNYSCTLV